MLLHFLYHDTHIRYKLNKDWSIFCTLQMLLLNLFPADSREEQLCCSNQTHGWYCVEKGNVFLPIPKFCLWDQEAHIYIYINKSICLSMSIYKTHTSNASDIDIQADKCYHLSLRDTNWFLIYAPFKHKEHVKERKEHSFASKHKW